MRSNQARFRALTLTLGLALALTACGGSGGDASTGSEGASSDSSGGATADLTFTATDLEGGTFDAASLEGTDTVLWFWAPWCTTCRAEAPDVNAVAAAFDGQVEVIGVAGRGEVPEMEGFVSDTDTGGLTHLVDGDGTIWSDFGVVAQPAFAFIDDSGEMQVTVGALGEAGLTDAMNELTAS